MPLGGGTPPDPLNGHCMPPEQDSWQKNKEIRRIFVKMYLEASWGIVVINVRKK